MMITIYIKLLRFQLGFIPYPTYPPIKTTLHYIRNSNRWEKEVQSQRGDSNPRPAVYETAALPLSYAGIRYDFRLFLPESLELPLFCLTHCFFPPLFWFSFPLIIQAENYPVSTYFHGFYYPFSGQ